MDTLRSENQRLKDENGALIRVISKLSKWWREKYERELTAISNSRLKWESWTQKDSIPSLVYQHTPQTYQKRKYEYRNDIGEGLVLSFKQFDFVIFGVFIFLNIH